MIITARGIELDLQTLEQIIQQRLNANISGSALKVCCLEKKESIVIVVQHPEDVVSHPSLIFQLIRSTIQEKQIPDEVFMYLVVDGQRDPYFSNQIASSSQANSASELKAEPADNLDNNTTLPEPKNKPKRFSFLLISCLLAISCLVTTLLIYFFTRPCVLDECSLIPQTKKIADESLSSLSENSDRTTLIEINKQLAEAINNLQKIPSWSTYHAEAEQLISDYQVELNQIQELLAAFQLAEKAKAITHQAPLSQEKWQEIAELWQKSLNILSTNSRDDRNILVNKKIEEYQQKLAIIKEKIQQEQEGKKYLLSAQDAAKLGESRQILASSLTNLQLVEATWRTAIERLEKIPIETTAYSQKQDLLASYIAKFLEAQQRTKEEELAIKLYNQAINEAKLAKNSEAENQWSLAVSSWRNALTSIQEVPEKSFQAPKAIKLVQPYQEALNKAQANLKIALLKEQAKNDLSNTCSNSPKICDYSISNNLIKVFLSKEYINQLQQLSNQGNNNNSKNERVINHISQVEKNFKFISSKYGLPLEVYHSEGNLMIKYEPNN
jgi:hypothetical protein